jgi:hypothetical protein
MAGATVLSGLPRLSVAQDGVEDGDELSHEGDEGDLGLLAGGQETLSEGLEDRVVQGAGEGGHVGDIADRLSAAEDVSLSAQDPAVEGVGRDPDEGGRLSVGEPAEFWHQGQQGVAEDGSDAGDRAEQLVLARQLRIGLDGGRDGLVEGQEIVLQPIDAPAGQAPEQRLGGVLGLVGGAGDLLAESAGGR